MMEETYDQFNLMQVKEEHNTINFDPAKFKRRVPKGVFPHPNKKRLILQ